MATTGSTTTPTGAKSACVKATIDHESPGCLLQGRACLRFRPGTVSRGVVVGWQPGETLNKFFDRLRTNAKWLISFVVNPSTSLGTDLSNHTANQLVPCSLSRSHPRRAPSAHRGVRLAAQVPGLAREGTSPGSNAKAGSVLSPAAVRHKGLDFSRCNEDARRLPAAWQPAERAPVTTSSAALWRA
jgi:hypothetical protein